MKLENMTAPQQEAITSKSQRILVLAGPGSGKTATTVARINHLIDDGVAAGRIVVLTFTNAAAREIEKRIYDSDPEHEPWGTKPGTLGYTGTLHGFALRMLKKHGGHLGYGARMSIISPESALDLLASKAQSLGCKLKIEELQKLKARGRPPRMARMDVPATVIASYYQDLQDAGIVDFDILLTEFERLLGQASFRNQIDFEYLFVDEVQDSAPIDWEIYHALPIANKFYVGDPDQAIYSFRGGDVNGMLWVAQRPDTHLIKLEENFRSHSEICEVAQRLIEHNRNRIPKQTISVKGPGATLTLDLPPRFNAGAEIAEVGMHIRILTSAVENDEIAVLCRTNAIAWDYQQALEAAGIQVVKRERSTTPKDWPLTRALVELMANPENDTLAYFYLVTRYLNEGATPKDARSAAHAVQRAAASIGSTINRSNLHLPLHTNAAGILGTTISQGISAESRMLLGEIVREVGAETAPEDLALALNGRQEQPREEKKAGVHVLTIHAAKGREFDAVFLVGWEDEVIPGKTRTEMEVEEERRLAYVAITRARSFLMITSAETRTTPWGAIASHTPSRFLREIAK